MTVYGGPVFEESVSAVTATPSVDLGSRRVWKGEQYLYCFNAGGSSINVDYGVRLITAPSGYSVAGTGVSDTEIACVGVIKHATMTTDAYGWVLTKGFTTIHAANSSFSNGPQNIGGQVTIANKGLGFGVASGLGTNIICGVKAQDGTVASTVSFYAFINTGF